MYIFKTKIHIFGDINEKNLEEFNAIDSDASVFKILEKKIVQCEEYLGNLPGEIIEKISEISSKQGNVFILEYFEDDAGLNYDIYLENKTIINIHFDTTCGIEKSPEEIVMFLGLLKEKNETE